MPAFDASNPSVYALYPGSTQTVWNAEAPATGAASAAVGLASPPFGEPFSLSVELVFSGDPGVFRVDLQDADTYAAASFLASGATLGSIAAATLEADGTYRARFEVQCQGRFVRLYMQAAPANAVTTTARISR